MNIKNTKEKKIILRKLVNSGINITPSLLEIILDLDDPLQKVNLIIKDSSFIASFQSHLTKNILTKISNEEIKRVVRRKFITQEISSSEENLDNNIEKPIPQPMAIKNSTNTDIESSAIIDTEIFPEKPSNGNFSLNSPPTKEESGKTSQSEENNKKKMNPIEGAKSTNFFKPMAKEYDVQLEILKDPTGKLYTNGAYKDFYDLTFDKFNRLRTLMRKRTEVHGADNINNILRLSNKVEVSVIGMVNTIRKTKNGNYFLTLEDLTGLINVLIKVGSENQDNLNMKIAERTLTDQMVYIEGTYNPGEKHKSSIIYGNFISKIDVPKDFEPNKSQEPLSLA
ncbi:MAG: hypothetical protein ACW96X_11655, partial [Promethearchaeota archaeon]